MPVDVDELARIGAGQPITKKAEKSVSVNKTAQKANIQTVDDLATIGSGGEVKKKVGSEGNTNNTLQNQSTTKLSDEAINDLGITLGDNTQQPKSNVSATQIQFANIPKPKTAQEKLVEEGKNIVAKQEATKKSVDLFNQAYGTKFNVDEINTNPDKAADFLSLYTGRFIGANTPEANKPVADFNKTPTTKLQGLDAALASYNQPNVPSANTVARNELIGKGDQNLNLLKNKVVDLTLDEGKMQGIPKAQVINNLYKRLDPKGYEKLSNAVTERATAGLTDIISGGPFSGDNTKAFELLNTEKAPYELAYNESLKRQANNLQVMGTLNKDQSMIDAGKSIAAQVQSDDDIYAKSPTLNKSRIASDISNEIAGRIGQLQGTESEGFNNTVDKLGLGNDLTKGRIDVLNTEAFKKYYNNPTTRDAALEVATNPESYLSDATYFGGVAKNIAKPFKELGLSLLDITGIRDKMDRLNDAKNEELFPEVTPQLKGYVSKIKGAINTTSYLTGMMAMQIPGTALGAAAGLEEVGATRAGTAMAFGIPSFDANLKDADNFLENDGAKAAYATVGAMINTVGGEFLELGKISKFSELQKPLLNLSEKMTDKNITTTAVNELLDKAKDPYIDVMMKYGTNVTKGAATMSYFTFANGVNKMLFGGNETTSQLVENTGTAFIDGVLGMAVLGGFGAHADMKKEKNTTYKNNIYQWATNSDATRDIIETAYKKGEYSRPAYNEKVAILNTSIAAKNNLAIAEAGNNVTLNEQQKAVYVSNRTAEGVIKKQLESPLLTEQQKSGYENQIKRLQTQREDILKGLTFNDNLEPLDAVFKAQLEYKKAYEDFNEGVIENDSQVIAAKENLQKAIADNGKTTEPITATATDNATIEAEKAKNDMAGLSHADWFLKNKDKFSDEEFNRINTELASTNEAKKQTAVDEIISKKEEVRNAETTTPVLEGSDVKKRNKIIQDHLLDNDGDIDGAFKKAGYTNINGIWVAPEAVEYAKKVSPEVWKHMKDKGIKYLEGGDDGRGLQKTISYDNKNIRGIGINENVGESHSGHDHTMLHETAHHVWQEELTPEQKAVFGDDNPVSDYAKSVKAGKEKTLAKHDEEDFAELYAKNNGDIEKAIAEKKSQSSKGSDVKSEENKKGLEALVNQIPTTELRRPDGSIGTQGFMPENIVDVARFIAKKMGFDIPAHDKTLGTSEIKQVIDYLKSNKEAQDKIKDYVIQDPVVVQKLPDDTYSIEDGNHRANLLNLIGVDVIPTIDLDGKKKQDRIDEHNKSVDNILNNQSENKPIQQNEAAKTIEDTKQAASQSTSNESANKNSETAAIEKAKDLVNSGVVKGFTSDVLKDAAANDVEGFKGMLKDISEQAQDPRSEPATVKTYGQELVDIANELNPKEDISSQSKTQSNERNGKENDESSSQKTNDQIRGVEDGQDGRQKNDGKKEDVDNEGAASKNKDVAPSKKTDTKDLFEGDNAETDKKEFDKMTSSIPNGGEIKKYLSGDTIKKYENGTELRNNQEITAQELEPALKHGVDTIDKAKEIFGEDYVSKTLDYIDRENINPENKALLYVSLENELAKRVAEEPDNLDLKKKQDLVRTKSQAFLRSSSLAINMGRLRKFAEAGYDISKVTDKFFSSKEREQKSEVEKLVQADADTIQKQAEENYKASNLTDAEIEAKVKEGVGTEIAKLYEALPKEKKTAADKAIAALDKVQQKLRNKSYSDATGIVAFIDAGITTMKAAIKAGVKIADAVEMGIAKIKEKYGKEWPKEDEFRKDVLDGLKSEGAIDKERAKQAAKEYRVLETERNRQLRIVGDLKDKISRYESGKPTEKDIREQKVDVPEIEGLKVQLKEAQETYNKKVAEINRRETNIKKLEAELDRVKDRREKESKEKGVTIKVVSEKESDLMKEIESEKEKWQQEKDWDSEKKRQIDRISDLQGKLDKLQKGERPETKTVAAKIDTPYIEKLKQDVKDATKNLNAVEAQQRRINELEAELDRLQNRLPKEMKESMKREISDKEAELRSKIDSEKEAIRKDEKYERLFGNKNTEEKSQSERLADAKEKINNDIEVVREEILRKQRVNEKSKNTLQDDQELSRLREQKKTLENLRDTYLGQDQERYKNEKALNHVKDRLTKEVMDINKQINDGQKTVKDKKEPLTGPEIDALKAEKETRQSILEAIDPTPKEYVEDALIKQGFGKTINVKTKDGVVEKNILDWKKLAGEEGSVSNISKHVAEVMKGSGFTPEQLDRMSDAFIKEYTDLRASVIQKGLNEIAARNKETVTPDQKSAAKKLAEMYNYGLFDKDLEGYETALAKTIGVDKLNAANLKEALVLGKAISQLLSSRFQGERLTESQMRSAIQVIENEMRHVLHSEATSHGSSALKIADTVRTYMDLTQRMTLNSLKQAAENPLSGALEQMFTKLGYQSAMPDVLSKQASKIARGIYKEMVLQKGQNFGEVASTFVNKGNLEMELDKLTDNQVVQGVLSTVIGRTTLDAVDSMYKAKITQQKFTYNLIKILQNDRMVDGKIQKGMSKQEAKNYVAEKLTGQSFKEAQDTAKNIIDHINKDAGRKIFNDSQLFVDRLANDIVTAALVNGEKISEEMVTAAYNAAYKAAGRGLGHVANNFISEGIGSVSGKLESKINEAVKEKEYKKAAMLTYASIFFRNIANPFVGGGTNWVVLKAEKSGLGLLSGLGSMMYGGRKMDLTSEAGVNDLERAMYQNLKVKDKFLRGAIGGAATVVGAMIMAGVTTTDEYRKWRLKNKWAAKYIDLVTPEIILAGMAKESKQLKYYFETAFNKNDAFDKGTMAVNAITSALSDERAGNKKDTPAGKFGKLAGSMFGAPTPWRLIRDGQQIWQGASGEDPYKVDNSPSQTFLEGYFKGGMIDYMGFAPKP